MLRLGLVFLVKGAGADGQVEGGRVDGGGAAALVRSKPNKQKR